MPVGRILGVCELKAWRSCVGRRVFGRAVRLKGGAVWGVASADFS